MSDELLVTTDGAVRVVTINRPDDLNVVNATQVADHLTFTVVPTGVTSSGALLGDVTVEVRDAGNNKVAGDNTTSIQLTPQLVAAPG